VSFKYPTYKEWLEGLPELERERALKLADQFRANGCAAPEDWVRSEVSEDFCQFATYLFLSNLWRCEIDHPWSESPENWIREFSHTVGQTRLPVFDDAAEALLRLQEAQVSAKDLGAIARLVAYSTAFGVLNLLDAGADRSAAGDTPGWSLREMDAEGNLTGRAIEGLHESLLSIHEDSVKAGPGPSA
jgi:hypothetical protein